MPYNPVCCQKQALSNLHLHPAHKEQLRTKTPFLHHNCHNVLKQNNAAPAVFRLDSTDNVLLLQYIICKGTFGINFAVLFAVHTQKSFKTPESKTDHEYSL
jgi:hypothetical protein